MPSHQARAVVCHAVINRIAYITLLACAWRSARMRCDAKMAFLFHFFFASLLGILMMLAIVALIFAAIFGCCFLTVEQLQKTPEIITAAETRGSQDAEADINYRIQVSELEGSMSGARAQPLRNRRGMLVIALFALVACALARVEFGQVRGRFQCEDLLQCGRDNSYHELRFRVYPLEALGTTWTTVPWLFAPFEAEDVISGPYTCDPERTGQCYVLNGGNLTVSIRPTPLFWLDPLTRHPTYEFPSSYVINTTYIDDGDINAGPFQCTRLLYYPELFGDSGPCWKNLCMDGTTLVDTETVGVGPGCALFEFTHKRSRPAAGFQIKFNDTARKLVTTVNFDDVRPGSMVQSNVGTVTAHVDNVHIPGGQNWWYPKGLHGGIVACNWRAVWARYTPRQAGSFESLPDFEPASAAANWYYTNADIVNTQYALRGCGANGPDLSTLALQYSSNDCASMPSFADGACLPELTPAHILNGTTWNPDFVPPFWESALSRVALWQRRSGRRGLIHLAHREDFLPGTDDDDLYYDVVLRVATPVARTDQNNRAVFHSALCVEEAALKCVQDPISLVGRIDVFLGNRAPNANASNVTARVTCTYNDGGYQTATVFDTTRNVGTIGAGNTSQIGIVYMLPEMATKYVSEGNVVARSPLVFQCTVNTSTPFGVYNATYIWNGTLSCKEIINNIYIPPPKTDVCAHAEWELACRIQHGTLGESSGDVIIVIVFSVGGAFTLVWVIWLVYVAQTKHKVPPGDNVAQSPATQVPDNGTGAK